MSKTEVIKAIEMCLKEPDRGSFYGYCENCPYNEHMDCVDYLLRDALKELRENG